MAVLIEVALATGHLDGRAKIPVVVEPGAPLDRVDGDEAQQQSQADDGGRDSAAQALAFRVRTSRAGVTDARICLCHPSGDDYRSAQGESSQQTPSHAGALTADVPDSGVLGPVDALLLKQQD